MGSAAGYYKLMSDKAYDNYSTATTVSDAVHYKEITRNYENYAKITVYGCGTFALWTFYNWIRMVILNTNESKLSADYDFRRNMVQISLRF